MARSGGNFQCEECFYPGTGVSHAKRTVISSARASYWQELAEGLEPGAMSRDYSRRRAA